MEVGERGAGERVEVKTAAAEKEGKMEMDKWKGEWEEERGIVGKGGKGWVVVEKGVKGREDMEEGG